MSTKHFEYMFKDQDKGFFDTAASQIEKNAAAVDASLQKELDADIDLLRRSGPVGNFEFTKRAFAYISALAESDNPHPEFLPVAFEKVSSVAIHEDVKASLAGLDKEAKRQLVDDAIALVKKADELKVAGGGLAFLKGLGEAGKVVAKAPVETAMKTVQKGVRGLEDARLGATARSAKKLQRGADAALGASAAAEGSVGKAFQEGRAKSLQSSATKAMDSRDKQLTSMVGGRAKKLVPSASGNIAKEAPVAAKVEAPKAEAPKVDAKPEVAGEGKGPEGAAGGGKKSRGIMDSFHAARKEGWHSLSEMEQQKLISAGLGTGLAANVALNN